MYSKILALVPGGMQKSCIEVADFAVAVLHVMREVEVAAAFKASVLAGDQDKGPLSAAAVMCLGGIGKINDNRVV